MFIYKDQMNTEKKGKKIRMLGGSTDHPLSEDLLSFAPSVYYAAILFENEGKSP